MLFLVWFVVNRTELGNHVALATLDGPSKASSLHLTGQVGQEMDTDMTAVLADDAFNA